VTSPVLSHLPENIRNLNFAGFGLKQMDKKKQKCKEVIIYSVLTLFKGIPLKKFLCDTVIHSSTNQGLT